MSRSAPPTSPGSHADPEPVGIAVTSRPQWVVGARPRTLRPQPWPRSWWGRQWQPVAARSAWRAAAALVVALALQVGVNYANDYQDGVRGTDRSRVGPVGWSPPVWPPPGR